MSLSRRQLLKLLASGVVGSTLDVDRLLWVPGAKKIFLPSIQPVTISEIIAIEYQRVVPQIKELFERDDMFYANIKNRDLQVVSSRDMRIPLIVGVDWGKDESDS